MTWLTTYSIPQLLKRLTEFHLAGPQISHKDETPQVYRGLYAEPDSIQSPEEYQNREESVTDILLPTYLRDHLLVHMERSASCQSRMFSAHDSDIDLDEHMEPTAVALERMVSQEIGVFFTPSPQAFLDTRKAAVSSQPFHHQGDDESQSSLPDTQAVNCHSSISAGSKAPSQV